MTPQAQYDRVVSLFPPRHVLSDWQRIQYDVALEMTHDALFREVPYDWSPKSEGGVLAEVRWQGALLARAGTGVYCSGVVFEHFVRSWTRWCTERDVVIPSGEAGVAAFRELRAFAYVYASADGRYDRGVGDGFSAFWGSLPDDPKGTDGLRAWSGSDPRVATFGTYVQLQSRPNIHASGGGHVGMLLSVQEDDVAGEPVARLWNANLRNDYGLPGGVGVGWYRLHRVRDGFERKWHIGGIVPAAVDTSSGEEE